MNVDSSEELNQAIDQYLQVHLEFAKTLESVRRDQVLALVEANRNKATTGELYEVYKASSVGRLFIAKASDAVKYAERLSEVDARYQRVVTKYPFWTPAVDSGHLFPTFVRGLWLQFLQIDEPLVLSNVDCSFILANHSLFNEAVLIENTKLEHGFYAEDMTSLFNFQFENSKLARIKLLNPRRMDRFSLKASRVGVLKFRAERDNESIQVNSISLTGGSCITVSADFSSSRFRGDFVLNDVRFDGRSNFRQSRFDRLAMFNADFECCPEFFGAELSAETRFDEMKLDGRRLGFSNPKRFVEAGARRSELLAVMHLRIEAQNRRWSRVEARFFAEEQRLERVLTRGRPIERFFSFAYDCASAYGSSVSRAAVSFMTWNVFFAMLFLGLLNLWPLQIGPFGLAIGLSEKSIHVPSGGAFDELRWLTLAVQNAVNPLALFTEKSLVSVRTFDVFALSLLQTVGSLTLFALLLLALRGRFQRAGSGGGF